MQIDVTFLDEIVKAILLQKKDYLANALKTEAGRAFLMHEHILNRKTTQKKIMQSFEQGDNHYNLQWIKQNINQIENVKKHICENQLEIVGALESRIEKYTNAKINPETKICFYAVGFDGGFYLTGNKLFINLSQCIDEWFSIVVHELYHSRKISTITKLRRIFCNLDFFSNIAISYKMRILCAEEGIATLIENDGKRPSHYDTFSNQYADLKRMIMTKELEADEIWTFFNKHNLRYKIGWLIAYDTYEKGGSDGLDCWSVEGDIHRYIK